MQTLVKAAAFFIITLGMIVSADAAMYQWTDPNGRVHFSETPSPNSQGAVVRATTYPAPGVRPTARASRYKTSLHVTGPQYKQPDLQQSRPAIGNRVEIFTTEWCDYCQKAIAFLKKHEIPFVQHDVEKDWQSAIRMRALGGRGGVPFAIIDEKKVFGFSLQRYSRVLGLTP